MQFPLHLNTCAWFSGDFTAQFWKHRCEISRFDFKTETLFLLTIRSYWVFFKKMKTFTVEGKETALQKLVTGKCKIFDSVMISTQKFWFMWGLVSLFHVEISLKRELMLRVGSTERDLKKNQPNLEGFQNISNLNKIHLRRFHCSFLLYLNFLLKLSSEVCWQQSVKGFSPNFHLFLGIHHLVWLKMPLCV